MIDAAMLRAIAVSSVKHSCGTVFGVFPSATFFLLSAHSESIHWTKSVLQIHIKMQILLTPYMITLIYIWKKRERERQRERQRERETDRQTDRQTERSDFTVWTAWDGTYIIMITQVLSQSSGELCTCWGSHPGLPVPNKPDGLCGCNETKSAPKIRWSSGIARTDRASQPRVFQLTSHEVMNSLLRKERMPQI